MPTDGLYNPVKRVRSAFNTRSMRSTLASVRVVSTRSITLKRFQVWSETESFYGSPANFSSTKWPVSKPALDRISRCTVSLDTLTSSIVRHLHTTKYIDIFFSILSFLVSSNHEAFVKNIAGLGWGYRRISQLWSTSLPFRWRMTYGLIH